METLTAVATIAFSVVSAVGAGLLAVRVARRSAQLHRVSFSNADIVLRNAERQRAMVFEEALKTARSQLEAEGRRLEEEREVVLRMQQDFEEELNERQSELDKRLNELNETEAELDVKLAEIKQLSDQAAEIETSKREIQQTYTTHLESKIGARREDVGEQIREELVAAEQLGATRWLLEHTEELKAEGRKFAREALGNVYSRYAPTFIWPKTAFPVQAPSLEIARRYFSEDSLLLPILKEDTEGSIELMEEDEQSPILRISGGAGIDKEVIRLTLEEVVSRNSYSPDRARALVQKHRKNVDRLILKLGEEAIKLLELPPMHPEILKLIGSLNFRTSHRQNQYFHSLEVARLAGMIADEIGADSLLAKRSGILHDIGKALDYRIEGSHAVISGDYASRYGEAEVVVDTVLSHHDDKVVETPHAYILKAADAMSGARPGARVDMEEGYQRRMEAISDVVHSFHEKGVTGSAIMHAGRGIHVFVDNRRIRERDIVPLTTDIVRKLEADVQFPGQIRVTVVRRFETSEVA